MDDIIVVGGGGHAKVVISIMKKCGAYNVLGYTDMKDRGCLLGISFLGDDAILEKFVRERDICAAVLGVGYVGVSDIRKRLTERLESLGFLLPAIISPHALVNEDVSIGKGAVVCDAAVINSGSRIGKYSIVNTNSTIDHDCDLGEFVHIAPGATLSGGVRVGSYTFIGAGATVIQYRTIGENCLIGAGAVVVDDCSLPGLYLGIPAQRTE